MQVWPRDLSCLSHAGISVAAGGVVTVGGLRYFRWNERVRERPGMFSRQPDVDRDRRRADLINRARLVRAHGWDDYRAVWSSGEVVGVAALLGDHDILEEFDESLQTVWARWAFDLWGLGDGQADVDDNCRQSRRWFIDTARTL